MMKKFNLICAALLAAAVMGAHAKKVTLVASDGPVTVDVPDDIARVIEDNSGRISEALQKNGKTKSDVTTAATKANTAYNDSELGRKKPFTTVLNAMDDFAKNMSESIPNAQLQQNVYAEAWIGKFIPGFHFGAGLDAGVASLDVEPLKDAAKILDINTGDVPDSVVFPTITLDAKIGGIGFPFDVGFSISTIDSTKIDALDEALDSISIKYFTIGGDIRYAVIKGGGIRPKLSVGAGGYYTKASVKMRDDSATASLDFDTTTLFLSAQASVKLLCLVPFLGGRVFMSKSSIDWDVTANVNWNEIGAIGSDAADYLILLPTTISGDASTKFTDCIRPQIFAGLGVDLFIMSITASASYDFVSQIPGAALSARISW